MNNYNDNFNLDRFIKAQKTAYPFCIQELKNGKKRTHWMWFIFPQLKELGNSYTSKYYGISSLDETRAFLNNSLLRDRYFECLEILLNSENNNINDILGEVDAKKLKSSITLFMQIDNNKIYNDLLKKYYNGNMCIRTLEIINKNN